MEGMKAYQRYQALRLHFTSDYDFIKYGGKIRQISVESFMKRKDTFFFQRLERRYKDEELTEYFVANFVSRSGVKWIGELSGIESEKIYAAWRKRIESFSYQLKQELMDIECDSLEELLTPKNGSHPPLLRLYLGNKISIETVLAFDIALGILKLWDAKIEDEIVWSDISRQLHKYRPFLNVDKTNIKKVMRSVFKS